MLSGTHSVKVGMAIGDGGGLGQTQSCESSLGSGNEFAYGKH